MSERKRDCCGCRHNIRKKDKQGHTECYCEYDGHYIGYIECFDGWCRHWAKDHTFDDEEVSDEKIT